MTTTTSRPTIGTPSPADLVVLPGSTTPCQQRLDAKRSWGSVLAVRTGSVVSGVRGDSHASTALLDTVLAALRIPELDDQVAPNFSVEITGEDRPRRLFLAYRAHQVVARRHDRDVLLSDLVTLLDDGARSQTDEAVAVLSGVLVTPGGEAVLVPVDVHRVLLSRRRQLEAAGIELLASRVHRYDAETGAISTETVDVGVAAALAGMGGAVEPVPARLAVRSWCVGARTAQPQALSGADALMACLPTVLNRDQAGMGAVLRALRGAVLRHPTVAMPVLSAGAQARAVLDAAGC